LEGAELGWLLRNFLNEVPGTRCALLVTPDGLCVSVAGLVRDQADGGAAMTGALYSTAQACGTELSRNDDQQAETRPSKVQQVLVQLDNALVFVISADAHLPPGAEEVGCLLAVLTAPDANLSMVGDQMAALVTSVAPHLVARKRALIPHGDAPGAGDGQ
jgi:predicted regulator of Ras-like GTPase activity (Roadblock/LC7/MglB family)